MKTIKFLAILLGLQFMHLLVSAQTGDSEAEMADVMRSNGRIYVVVAVVLVILIGLFFYLVRLDKKITRLEKENK